VALCPIGLATAINFFKKLLMAVAQQRRPPDSDVQFEPRSIPDFTGGSVRPGDYVDVRNRSRSTLAETFA
jgi:hypothetical protein